MLKYGYLVKKCINYYPFGLQYKGYNNTVSSFRNSIAQGVKFNGKELFEEVGLNTYDFGWRNYDSSLGRWFNFDPHSESYYSLSGYQSFANNPISFIDPYGRDLLFFKKDNSENGSKKIIPN